MQGKSTVCFRACSGTGMPHRFCQKVDASLCHDRLILIARSSDHMVEFLIVRVYIQFLFHRSPSLLHDRLILIVRSFCRWIIWSHHDNDSHLQHASHFDLDRTLYDFDRPDYLKIGSPFSWSNSHFMTLHLRLQFHAIFWSCLFYCFTHSPLQSEPFH